MTPGGPISCMTRWRPTQLQLPYCGSTSPTCGSHGLSSGRRRSGIESRQLTEAGILLLGLLIEVFYGRCTMGRWFFLYAQSFHFLWSRQHQIFLGLFKPTIGVVEFRCVCRVELLPINAFNTRKSQQAYGKNFGHRRSTHRHSSHGEAFLLPWLNRGTFGGVLRRGPYRAGLRRKLKRRRDLEQKFYGQLCVENLLRVVLNNFKTNISRDSII